MCVCGSLSRVSAADQIEAISSNKLLIRGVTDGPDAKKSFHIRDFSLAIQKCFVFDSSPLLFCTE